MAVDTRMVSRAIEFHYRQALQSGRKHPVGELGMEYLAKIVQVPFLLPRPGRTELVALMGGRQPAPDGEETAPIVKEPGGTPLPGTNGPSAGGSVAGAGSPEQLRPKTDEGQAKNDQSDEPAKWHLVALQDTDMTNLVDLALPLYTEPPDIQPPGK